MSLHRAARAIDPMPRKLRLPLLAAAFAIILVFCFALATPLPWQPQLADLFLQEASLPEQWDIRAAGPHRACSASPLGSGCPTYGERTTYTFGDSQQWASEIIFRFRDADAASSQFDQALYTEMVTSSEEPAWEPTSLPQALFRHASREYSACRSLTWGRECAIAAQYQRFVVIFMATPVLLDDSQLALVAEAIDRRMRERMR